MLQLLKRLPELLEHADSETWPLNREDRRDSEILTSYPVDKVLGTLQFKHYLKGR
jgi:hypothetical protein